MKPLRDLTLLDKFLFDQTMDIPEAHEAALQIILGQETLKLLVPSQTEKEIRTAPWLRSIRLDVYALDEQGTVYDTEMQADYRNDLVKRSRYYQSLIDSSLLKPGTLSFNELNNTCIIMITPFDLFGEGKFRYTFRPRCDENPELPLKDGTVRIFLNTKGTNHDEVSRELIDFLRYVEKTDEQTATQSDSERIQKIHSCVNRIKISEEIGVKYMQTWEEEIIKREKALAEGIAIGEQQGIAIGEERGILLSIRNLMANLNLSAEKAMEALAVPIENRDRYLEQLK